MATQSPILRRSSLKATLARVAIAVAALSLVGGVIIQQSRAAFSSTTANSGNAFNAATIALTDNDNGVAMFNVPAMVPGDSRTGCITVSYSGSADPAPVKLYVNAYSETDGAANGATLDDALTFKIEKVAACLPVPVVLATVTSGTTLTTLGTNHTNYTNGLSAQWDPAAAPTLPESVSYSFTATFTPSGSTATDNTRQGDTISGLTFTWETQAGS